MDPVMLSVQGTDPVPAQQEAARDLLHGLAADAARRLRLDAACVAEAAGPEPAGPCAGPGREHLRALLPTLGPLLDRALRSGTPWFGVAPGPLPGFPDAVLGLVPVARPGEAAAGCLVVLDPRRDGWTETERLALECMAAAAAAELGCRAEAERRARAERRLRLLDAALWTVDLGVTITDEHGRIVYTNPAEARMHGYEVEELYGREARSLAPPELWSATGGLPAQRARRWTRQTVNVRRDGSRFPVRLWSDALVDDGDRPVGLVTYCEDLTGREAADAARRDREAERGRDAEHDSLTGLLTRAAFLRRLEQACAARGRPGGDDFSVLFVDLDRFKAVNDRHGHAAGDALLAAVGARLASCVRPTDAVGRVGGDEFAVLLLGTRSEGSVVPVVRRIQQRLAEPVAVGAVEARISASIGIAPAADCDTPEGLLASADRAMYRAKALGPGHYGAADPELESHESAVGRLEDDLRLAVARDELALRFQPIVSLADGRLAGFEALVRWDHPTRGLLGPQAFLPVAERTELIVEIDRWVLRAVARQLGEWTARHPALPPTPVSVNFSGRHVAHPDVAEHTEQVLREAGVDPAWIMVEVTETAMVEDAEAAASALGRLRACGVRLCLDDFGTGYSSLAYLRQFPFDVLKIDRSFVQRIGHHGSDRAIVQSVVALAHTLGLSVTAEGVETPRQWAVLRRLGCEHAQGYIFAHPMTPAEAEGWLGAGQGG